MRFALAAASLILAATFTSPVALAGAQQERMTKCNADAKAQNLAGEPRKDFMKSCLSGKTQGATPATPATPATQQDKMRSCNKTAGDKALKGDERKAFMSDCLKG